MGLLPLAGLGTDARLCYRVPRDVVLHFVWLLRVTRFSLNASNEAVHASNTPQVNNFSAPAGACPCAPLHRKVQAGAQAVQDELCSLSSSTTAPAHTLSWKPHTTAHSHYWFEPRDT